MRVLVIDDSRAIRSILRRILRDMQFEVLEASNGREALEVLAASDPPDLVMVDWNMPEMNGLEFIKAVRADERYRALPLLMVTSESELGHVGMALEAGCDEYAMKPFTADVIRDKLALMGVA